MFIVYLCIDCSYLVYFRYSGYEMAAKSVAWEYFYTISNTR